MVRLHAGKRRLTWTQGATGALLHRHALAERPPVERRGVGAGAGALLHAAPAAHVAGRPVCPGRPAPVHWGGREDRGKEVRR